MTKIYKAQLPRGPAGEKDPNDLAQSGNLRIIHEAVAASQQEEPGSPEEFRATTAEAPSLLKPVSLENFTTIRSKPTEYVIGPLIPRGFVTLLGGHGEIGKSMLGLTLAAHVATGQAWAGLPTRQGRVLYLSMEDSGDIAVFRLQRIAEEYRLDPTNLIANLTITDASDAGPLAHEVSNSGVKVLLPTALADEVGKLVKGFDLCVIDNASDAFDGDENSRRQVRAFIKSLAGWVKGHHGAVLLLAHIDKSAARFGANGNTYSGSTAWHNSARSRIALTRNGKEDTIELAHEKLNVGLKLQEPLALEWSEAGVLVPVSAMARESARALVDSAHDQDVYHTIRAALESGKVIPTATTGPSTCWHALCAFPELPTELKNKAGKPKLEATLIRLQRQGLIRPEKYRQDYKSRERWILC